MGKYVQRDVRAGTSLSVNAGRTVRPLGALIHTTEGSNSLAWLQGASALAGRPASADYLIGRAGQRYAICPKGRYSFHAGRSALDLSQYTGNGADHYVNEGVSEALIGIELERRGVEQVTVQQVDSLAELIVAEAVIYGWRWPFYIIGHYSVARPIGRRSDPVNFDWGQFAGRLWQLSKQQAIGGT